LTGRPRLVKGMAKQVVFADARFQLLKEFSDSHHAPCEIILVMPV
jgi:hypothetical protein